MINNSYGRMHDWSSGPMWLWTVIGISVVVLLFVGVNKMSKKRS